jgi:GNAT superfamily N-acetyltransferase
MSGTLSHSAILVEGGAERERFCAVPGPTPLSPKLLQASGADEHWLLDDGGRGVARCTLWWRRAPAYKSHRVGLIGHYAAEDAAAGELLRLACERLHDAGCTLAVGPMDGSTFRRYRLVTERGREPPFFLEPDNPDSWPTHFTKSGFSALARYYSALQQDLEQRDPGIFKIEQRLAAEGVSVRSLDPEAFERELHRIYGVVAASFTRNPLASSIDEAEFVAEYRPLEPFLEPELVQIAEIGERTVGFLLVMPDWLQAQRGEQVDTAIVKTVAVLPELAHQGLGTLMCARAQEIGHELGYARAIHALMHEDNFSRRLSLAHGGGIIRRYTLFAKELGVSA